MENEQLNKEVPKTYADGKVSSSENKSSAPGKTVPSSPNQNNIKRSDTSNTSRPMAGQINKSSVGNKASKKDGNNPVANALNKFNGAKRGIVGGAQNIKNKLEESTKVGEESGSSEQSAETSSDVDDTTKEVEEKTKKAAKVVLKLVAFLILKIVGIIGGILIFVIMFICVLFLPLIILGIVDLGDGDDLISGLGINRSRSSYDSFVSATSFVTTDNTDYWLPIGSTVSTTIDGVEYDTGEYIATKIISPYGERNDPTSGERKMHYGIDIVPVDASFALGTINIIAAKDGKVVYPKADSNINCPTSTTEADYGCGAGLGNYVSIVHDDGMTTRYGHMYAGTILVKDGDFVKQGQVIGKMGSSGHSNLMHLHLAVLDSNGFVDPAQYFSVDNPRPNVKTAEPKNGETVS